jgi:hypothetical protein
VVVVRGSLLLIFAFGCDAALKPMSLNVVTPPRQSATVKPLQVLDDLEKLVSLLRMHTSHLQSLPINEF